MKLFESILEGTSVHGCTARTGYAHSARSRICMRGAFRPNCHMLALSLKTLGNAPTAFMAAAARLHCI
jgi:hypothetical protein